MIEEDWLKSTDAAKMLSFICPKASNRKLRLFACAWCRYMWHCITDERSRAAVEIGERYADGRSGEGERTAALDGAWRVVEDALAMQSWEEAAAGRDARRCVEGERDQVVRLADHTKDWHPQKCVLLRDIFGNPFRRVNLDQSCLTRGVLELAQAIYDQRAFERMSQLADALEDAGCADATILEHLRLPGAHVRGCWVIDLVLCKS